jgi:Protein of unknown function (DUF3386)
MNAGGWLIRRVPVVFAALVLLGFAPQVRAHFLFIRINAPAEAGRSAEVFFSEQAEAGDPKFVAKIAHTALWIQTQPGEFRELPTKQAADRLRASLPSDRTMAVVGKCEYGVLARPKETPFLLRYYPKAVAGNADELNRLIPRREIPFEIQPTFESQKTDNDKTGAGRIRLVALRNGKPVPNAVFTAVDSDLSEQTIKADSGGSALWTPTAPGRYSVYVRETLKEPGVVGDKKFDEIREFATLALTWPLVGRDADSDATALFKDAIAHRAVWRDFPGFSAEMSGHVDGRPFTGSAKVKNDGSVEIQTDDPVAKSWFQDQLDSLVMHRIAPSSSESADAHQPKMRFADDDDEHPLGRLLAVDGDQMGSSYRIKNQQISVVNRRMGKQNMTITVLDNDKNFEGRFLPHSYVVHFWDAATGKLNRVETFQERSQRVGSWDLPVLRSIVTASDAGLSVKVVNLSKHVLLDSK